MVHSGRVGIRYNNGKAASASSSSQSNGDHSGTPSLNDSLPLYGAEELMEDDEEETGRSAFG